MIGITVMPIAMPIASPVAMPIAGPQQLTRLMLAVALILAVALMLVIALMLVVAINANAVNVNAIACDDEHECGDCYEPVMSIELAMSLL